MRGYKQPYNSLVGTYVHINTIYKGTMSSVKVYYWRTGLNHHD